MAGNRVHAALDLPLRRTYTLYCARADTYLYWRLFRLTQVTPHRVSDLSTKVSLDGFFSPGGLLVPSATERGGFDALDAYANDKAVARLPNRLGKRVTRSFVDPDGDGAELKVYRGLVIGFDPADQEQAFQIWYEDRDTQWIPTSLLDKLLVTPANDNQLAAMAANVLAAPNDF
jgi:hypothetical protein